MFTDGWMDEQSVRYVHTKERKGKGSLEKVGKSDMCYSRDSTWKYYAKWNKQVTKGPIVFHIEKFHI